MPKTTVKQSMRAAELRELYGGRTREDNLRIMEEQVKTRFSEIRLISGFIGEEDALAPQSTAGSRREED